MYYDIQRHYNSESYLIDYSDVEWLHVSAKTIDQPQYVTFDIATYYEYQIWVNKPSFENNSGNRP